MKNFIQPGNVITVTAPAGGVLSGAGLLVGSLFGIANGKAAQDEDVELSLTGVYALPKVSAQAWTQGAKIYWDNATKLATTAAAAGANALIGVATKAAANPSAEGEVRLSASFTI
jgi:predicted RecA/RadA family phage recombinase